MFLVVGLSVFRLLLFLFFLLLKNFIKDMIFFMFVSLLIKLILFVIEFMKNIVGVLGMMIFFFLINLSFFLVYMRFL